MPNDHSGSAAAEVTAGGAVDAATGAVRKQPATSTSSMSPTLMLMMRVMVLPSRNPTQCKAVNIAMTPMATARGAAAVAGQSVPKNVAAVSAA